MSDIKKFFIQFSHFLTGGVFSLLLGLITFPILTRILSTEQYGIVGLVSITMLLTVALSKAGLSNGIIRYYQNYKNSEEQRTIFASTVFLRGIIISIVVTFLYLIIFPIVRQYIGIDIKFQFCFIIMASHLFIRPINIIIMNMLRVNDKTIFLNVLTLLSRVITIILSLSLLYYIVRDFYGYFIGIIAGEYFMTIVLFYWFFKNYNINPKTVSKGLTVDLIKFGAPLLVTELAYLILSFADRYMIVAWHGESALGIYSAGYNLAMYIVNILTFSLAYSVIPVYVEVYEKHGKEKTEEFLNKSFRYLLIAILAICFGYYAIVNELFVFLASEKYASAAYFSPIILLGTFIMEMNNIFNAGLYLKKKSMTILSIMIIAVVVNISLNIVLIPRYNVMGAAVATLIACIISSVLTIILSFKYIFIKVGINHLIYYLLLSLIMFYAVQQIHIPVIGINILIKILTGVFIITTGALVKEKEIRNFIKIKLIK